MTAPLRQGVEGQEHDSSFHHHGMEHNVTGHTEYRLRKQIISS